MSFFASGAAPAGAAFVTPAMETAILSLGYPDIVYTAEIVSYNLIGGAANVDFFADRHFDITPMDVAGDQWVAPILQDFSISRGAFYHPLQTPDTRAHGSITLANVAARFDDFQTERTVAGGRIVIKCGRRGNRIGQHWTVFTGECISAAVDDQSLTISFKDPSGPLENVFWAESYGGTGDLDGTSDLEDVAKPRAIGWAWSVTPVLLNGSDVYQIDAGPDGIAYDRASDRNGTERTYYTNYADLAALEASAALDASNYGTVNGDGLIRLVGLGSDSIPLVDFWTRCPFAPNASPAYYSPYPSSIARQVLEELGLRLDARSAMVWDAAGTPAAIFATGVNQLPGGIVLSDGQTGDDILATVLAPQGIFWACDRNGVIYLQGARGMMAGREDDSPTAAYEPDDGNIINISAVEIDDAVSPVIKRLTVNAIKNERPLPIDQQAASPSYSAPKIAADHRLSYNVTTSAISAGKTATLNISGWYAEDAIYQALLGKLRKDRVVTVTAIGHGFQPGDGGTAKAWYPISERPGEVTLLELEGYSA